MIEVTPQEYRFTTFLMTGPGVHRCRLQLTINGTDTVLDNFNGVTKGLRIGDKFYIPTNGS